MDDHLIDAYRATLEHEKLVSLVLRLLVGGVAFFLLDCAQNVYKGKGHEFKFGLNVAVWFILILIGIALADVLGSIVAALLYPIIRLLHAFTIPPKEERSQFTVPPQDATTKPCPFCAEPIRTEAIKCRFCGSDLRQRPSSTVPPPSPVMRNADEFIFRCDKCSQELAVDITGIGQTIQCPACNQYIEVK